MSRSFGIPVLYFICLSIVWFSCRERRPATNEKKERVIAPVFQEDSAFALLEKQLAFGPRIPNTPAHQQAADFIIRKLKSYGARVYTQPFESESYDGKKLRLVNIIGSFRPEVQKRVVLAAHWDTRPFSDKDPVSPDKPFDGANDGASGVAVLLEVARNLQTAPNVGVDIIFFDGEDWGEPDGTSLPTPSGLDSWYCLGSQYWSKNKHLPGYRAYFGILLDMVGGKDAQFFKEGASVMYAPNVVDKVWSTAASLGYGSTFIMQKEGPITDDHVFVNRLAGIPMIDITPFQPGYGYFGEFHHTQQDNISVISRKTLGIVGRVVMQVVYLEE